MDNEEMVIVVKLNKETRIPNYEFKGRWTGRWLKLVMAKMPRAYRKIMAEKLKEAQKEELEIKGVSENDRNIRSSDTARTTTVRRAGQGTKRNGKVKARSGVLKKGKRTDTERGVGQKNKFSLPKGQTGTAEKAKGSAALKPEPPAGKAVVERPDGSDERVGHNRLREQVGADGL